MSQNPLPRLAAAVLDWSGTTIDYGCRAPTAVFLQIFASAGVPITVAEARAPMGAHKRDHVRQILQMPAVAARWQSVHAAQPSEADVERLFEQVTARQVESVLAYADLIPGAAQAVAAFRARGLRIGTTTGYTRAMLAPLLPHAAAQGYQPDFTICSDEVPMGRPAPWMALRIAEMLGVYPMKCLVKIGDTVPDIEEGRNAAMWTIGLARTGNEVGLTEAELQALPPGEANERVAAAAEKLRRAGAHHVVDSLANTPPLIDAINLALSQGRTP